MSPNFSKPGGVNMMLKLGRNSDLNSKLLTIMIMSDHHSILIASKPKYSHYPNPNTTIGSLETWDWIQSMIPGQLHSMASTSTNKLKYPQSSFQNRGILTILEKQTSSTSKTGSSTTSNPYRTPGKLRLLQSCQ